MVLSGDVQSDCNLASFRHARFFDFFNEIGAERKLMLEARGSGFAPFSAIGQTELAVSSLAAVSKPAPCALKSQSGPTGRSFLAIGKSSSGRWPPCD
jgi:hypothetical protein